MGFTGTVQQFLRACCCKKNKHGRHVNDAVAASHESLAPEPLPSTALFKSKLVRQTGSKRQPISNKVISAKKAPKNQNSRRASSNSTTNSSSLSETKDQSKNCRASSSNKNSNKTKDDDDTQRGDSTATARSRRKSKSQRVTSRDKSMSTPSPTAVCKYMVDSAAFRVQLKQFAADAVRIGVHGLVEQFAKLKAATTAQTAKTLFNANRDRNRYKDVVCVDRTRVVLRWPADAANDYIHANWVKFKGERKFICTQAPVESTIDDFWRLVWQEKCKVIVMLCELVEQNKPKCEAYWPATPQKAMETASELCIKNIRVIAVEPYLTVSLLEVHCMSDPGAEPLEVRHFKWNNWPDRGVPENLMAPLRLLDLLSDDAPILIHCSAGIGRTGTIVGLHMALQVLNAGEPLSLAGVVRELRAQRHGSVQTVTQFLFMHRTLIQLALNMSLVSAGDVKRFTKDYDKLILEHGG